MNNNHIIVFDFETGGTNTQESKGKPPCEILQIGAVALHPTKLTVLDKFESLLKPLRPELVEDGALKVNGLTREQIENAPNQKIVWQDFTRWVKQFQKNNSSFSFPIAAGYNIRNFDMPLVRNMCKLYGPMVFDKFAGVEHQAIFSSMYSIDLIDTMWMLMENSECLAAHSETGKHNLKLTTVAKFMGLNFSDAHTALGDVYVCAAIISKILKLNRSLLGDGENGRVKFQNAFGGKTARDYFKE